MASRSFDEIFDDFLRHPDLVQQPKGGPDGEARAWCPWHEDRAGGNPSLGINRGKRAVKCWVCGNGGVKALARVWGIELTRDGANGSSLPPWEKEIEQTYDYRDANGDVLFQVVRFKVPPGAKKDFGQRRSDPARPDGWA